jgi:hypothetical protein
MRIPSRLRRSADQPELFEGEGGQRAAREPDPLDLELPSSRMRRNEAQYGYLVVVEMVVVAVLQLVIRTGPGAPKHPNTFLEVAALVVAAAQFGVIRSKNRTFTALGVIVSGLLIDIPTVPNRLVYAKLFAVLIPLIYGFVLMRRGNRSRKVRLAAGLEDGPGSRSGDRSRDTTTTRGRNGGSAMRGRRGASRKRATGRYTPPKPKPDESKKR